MTRVLWSFCILQAAVLAAGVALSQGKKNKKTEEPSKEEVKKTVVAAPEPSPPALENALADCTDGQDNDTDGHVDCDDQDCLIYAVCVKTAPEEKPPQAEAPPQAPVWIPESGIRCRDGKDNNADGLIDCHEPTCQGYRYCRQQMYEVPEPTDKAPGLLVNFAFGVALPNFRKPTAIADTPHYGEVPFDPDIGGIAGFKFGYLPLKWLGFGANLMGGVSAASNRREFFEKSDDPDSYKYIGEKSFGHVGGFLRFDWQFDRIVPYLDVAAGYSFANYKWRVYDASNDWEDIGDNWDDGDDDDDFDDENDFTGIRDTNTLRSRHFTFALEPGIDFYVSKRRFAIGLNAWLPIVASNDSSTDNVGVMLNFTYAPMWREAPQLKPEYDIAMAK